MNQKTLSVCITNLGKYNDGEIIYKWLDLPTTEEEIKKTLTDIKIGAEYEEYFVSDYTSDIGLEVEEYNNIYVINDLVEQLEEYDYNLVEALADYLGGNDLQGIIDLAKNDCIGFVEGIDAEDYERQVVEDCYDLDFDKLGWLANYISIDYEAIARCDDDIYETSNGVLYGLSC